MVSVRWAPAPAYPSYQPPEQSHAALHAPLPAIALALGACNDPSDPGKERVIGRIDPSHTAIPVIVAPHEVAAQARFSVVVNTLGTFGCSSPDGQDVSEDGALIRIVPYDIVAVPGHTEVCPSQGIVREHHVSVFFRNRGEARLRVVGTSVASRGDRLDSIEVGVVVK
jgi:hypothetical protein